MNTPFFTVIIPTYNRAEMLREAIQSVIDQTFPNFEVIVIDDHSTDHTKSVVASFRDNRIKYITNDHTRGGAGTRNAGIFRAKGNWIGFLDDDDLWARNKLELHYKKIVKLDEDVGLVYSGRARFNTNTKRELSVTLPEKEGRIQQELLYHNWIGSFSNVTIRSDILKKVGGLDERFKSSQDMELYVRIAAICKITYVKEILSYYRVSNHDKISRNLETKLMSAVLFWEKYEKLINKSLRLQSRAAIRVFIAAFKQKDTKHIIKTLPLTLVGLFFDIKNVKMVCGTIYHTLKKNFLLRFHFPNK